MSQHVTRFMQGLLQHTYIFACVPIPCRAVNAIEMGMEATNAVCMALLAVSSIWWDETDNEDWAGVSVFFIQIGVLWGRFIGFTGRG